MREELQKKVDRAIRLIRSAVGGGQIEVAFSGGKDVGCQLSRHIQEHYDRPTRDNRTL